jgi:hypothetical protein
MPAYSTTLVTASVADPDPGGQNDPKEKKKVTKFHLLRAEDLSCSLGVLYGSLRKSKLQFLIKNRSMFSSVFFQF